ncbi:energy transducer TonB [Planctobacterium marinum]|uniref:TonB C-terminal domain-containing protein n=1 Tax=Planctobacterium marinum TaxID=1631968 RepID=A0AA48HRE0_9ALTE|nr:hypothetical protein MACH26_28380 [Planctobacterium marinum]
MKNGLIILLLSLVIAPFAQAADNLSVSLETLISAEPLERKPPKYPRLAAKKGQEGWVRLSFVIDEQGNVIDPIVHDSSGVERFEKAALKAVKDWKYSPAMVDGKPVEQCNSKVQLDFRLGEQEKGVTRQFLKKYKKLRNAVIEGDIELADDLYTEFKEESHHNFSESVHAAVVSATYFSAKQDVPQMTRELETIANNGYKFLGEESYLSLSGRLLMLKIEQNKLSEALELIAKINEVVDADASGLAPIKEMQNKLQQYIENNQYLVVKGKIHSHKAWYHQLLLNKFDLVSEGNAFERIEIRCKNKRSTYSNFEKQGFAIPEDWGQCHIYVDAPQGTEFSLVEYSS